MIFSDGIEKLRGIPGGCLQSDMHAEDTLVIHISDVLFMITESKAQGKEVLASGVHMLRLAL